jgi:hypothetical protein
MRRSDVRFGFAQRGANLHCHQVDDCALLGYARNSAREPRLAREEALLRCRSPRLASFALFMNSPGVAAMVQNLVVGLVVVALLIMGVLAYAQKHEGCLRGRSLQTFQPCGSVGVDM